MRHSYHIQEIDGYITIKDTSGNLLSIDDLNTIVKNINQSHQYIATHQIDQSQYRQSFILNTLYNILEKSPITTEMEDTPCVYFITSPDYPNCVKIGSTVNLSERRKQLKQQLELRELPTVIFMLKTPDNLHSHLEYCLHEYFKEYRVAGEWFLELPMSWFIAYCKNIIKNTL